MRGIGLFVASSGYQIKNSGLYSSYSVYLLISSQPLIVSKFNFNTIICVALYGHVAACNYATGSPLMVNVGGEPSGRVRETVTKQIQPAEVVSANQKCDLQLKIPGQYTHCCQLCRVI